MTHTNNSSDMDITAFYDKQVRFSGVLNRDVFTRQSVGTRVSKTINSSRVNNVNVWPGRSHALNYTIPVGDLIQAASNGDALSWQMMNERIQKLGNNRNSLFREMTVGYDVHVRSKRSR